MQQYQDLIEELKKEVLSFPIYTLIGEEGLLISEGVDKIVDKALSGGMKDFNFNLFYAKESSIDDVLNAVRTLPLMAKKRVVVLKEIDQYPASILERLADYLKEPSDSTCLIITAKKMDQRTRFFKALQNNSMLISCGPLYENQVKSWIRLRAKSYGLEFTEDALNIFFEVAGNELGIIDNELKKLSSYFEGKKRIDITDVEELVGKSRVYSVFNLINAIGEKRLEKALLILKKMLNDGEYPLVILSMIARQFRLIARAMEYQREGLSPLEVSKRIGLFGNIFSTFKEQLKNFTLEEVLKKYRLLYNADSELKSGIRSPDVILNDLIFKLCRSTGEVTA
ncbi:MAG: DNA polymerase III subunit delta [Nitrospirae bacterium]|nr:DNA polymerase III subunit delta [Nitrospirota bacterium]